CAHGVDHGLRPEASQELDLVEDLAAGLKVEFSRTRIQLEKGGNLQARARRARYQALRAAALRSGSALIATGHHADDRAETVLLRLLRGAGPRGLAVLAPRDKDMIRPLLGARQRDIAAHLRRHGLKFAIDPSNGDSRFLRVRVRQELLPALERLSPGIVRHLNALADQLLAMGPSSPSLLDEAGGALSLSRAHWDQIRRAQERGLRRARILLPGGRQVVMDPSTGLPHLATASLGLR
ncbi:MAG TPA: tRNA lysidine(34) synthetase TilS, partial [Polyangiaceae bacterium]